jgi:hypothetical protein
MDFVCLLLCSCGTNRWLATAKGTVAQVSVVNQSSDPNPIGSYTLHGICAIQLGAQFAALCDGATTELDYLACKRTKMVSHEINTM